MMIRRSALAAAAAAALSACGVAPAQPLEQREYPWHHAIVAATFWVGEILDPTASDGSQEISTYDSNWMANYGGCDGVVTDGVCQTEPRDAANGFFPKHMTPLQNPFYLDLPFDDINNPHAFAMRSLVVPWADDPGYAGRADDRSFSYMKNRWVELRKGDKTCYGQVQDAGPAVYDDVRYVFGEDDAQPASRRFNGAGLDVSPALNGCLGFSELDGLDDRVDWRFVEHSAVPAGPWTRIITTSPVVPW